MQKILFIIPYIPYPLDSGGNQAFFNMVDYLRTQMNVSVLLYPRNGTQRRHTEQLKALWPDVTFYLFTSQDSEEALPAVRHPFYYKWLQKTKASVERKMRRQLIRPKENAADWDLVRAKSTLPTSVFEPFPAGYAAYVNEVCQKGFDIIQVEFYDLIALGYLLPQDTETIFVHHELRYIHNRNEMDLFKQVKAEDRMLYEIAKAYETDALRQYRHIIALTEVDRKLLAELLGRTDRIYASPAVVRLAGEDAAHPFIPATTCRLTFVGSENHSPNMDAVDWFCREIAPALRRKGVQFTFQLIGRWVTPYVTEQLRKICPELQLQGYVEDLGARLQGSIALVPIRVGSGMRMKILDAVSSGVPVITTTKGVEGLDFRSGSECLIADDTDGFAQAILRLSKDTALQEKLVNEARLRLRELYDPQEMLRRRKALYDSMKHKV